MPPKFRFHELPSKAHWSHTKTHLRSLASRKERAERKADSVERLLDNSQEGHVGQLRVLQFQSALVFQAGLLMWDLQVLLPLLVEQLLW